MELNKNNTKLIEYGIGAAIIYFGIINPLLKKLGVKTTTQEDTAQKQKTTAYSGGSTTYWNPNYWKSIDNAMLLTYSSTNDLMKQIYNAKGLFVDNEPAVYGAFKQLKYKTQVSWLADNFFKTYGKDIFGFLDSFLSDKELAVVTQITDNLQ